MMHDVATWAFVPEEGAPRLYFASRPWEDQSRTLRGDVIPRPFAGAPLPGWPPRETLAGNGNTPVRHKNKNPESGTSSASSSPDFGMSGADMDYRPEPQKKLHQQIAHALAPLKAQLDALQKEVDRLKPPPAGPSVSAGPLVSGCRPGSAPPAGEAKSIVLASVEGDLESFMMELDQESPLPPSPAPRDSPTPGAPPIHVATPSASFEGGEL